MASFVSELVDIIIIFDSAQLNRLYKFVSNILGAEKFVEITLMVFKA